MTDHERAAMLEAIEKIRRGGNQSWSEDMRATWEAARKYEPPAVCNARGPQAFRCQLLDDGHEEHRAGYDSTLNAYIGWPRT